MYETPNENKKPAKVWISDILTVIFLALTVSHVEYIFNKFDKNNPISTWSAAIGLEISVAFAAFIMSDNTVKSSSRWIASSWFVCTLALSYAMNVAYYFEKKADWWAVFWGALLPGSVAALGAIKPGLLPKPITPLREPEQRPTPVPASYNHYVPPPAADGGIAEPVLDLQELLEETEPLLVGASIASTQQTNTTDSDWRIEANRLYQSGMSQVQIAEKFGKSRSAVSRALGATNGSKEGSA